MTRPIPRLALAGLLATGALFTARAPAGERGEAPADGFAATVRPFLETYCLRCHSDEKKKGDLSLEGYRDAAQVLPDHAVWRKVRSMLVERKMPPGKRRQPSQEERDAVAAWIEAEFERIDCDGDVDPGHVTIRRLNRAEYNCTVRDLLGVDFGPADGFPADEVGYGFDTIGDVLSLPVLLLEKYLDAAEEVVTRALERERAISGRARYQAEKLEVTTASRDLGLWGRSIDREGEMRLEHAFPASGEYVLRARAYGEQAGPQKVRMAFRVDGEEVGRVTVGAGQGELTAYSVRARVEAGTHRVSVAYLNNYVTSTADRNLVLDWIEIEPAAVRTRTSRALERIISCRPERASDAAEVRRCARRILGDFAMKAFRRPVSDSERDGFVELALDALRAGDSFDEAIALALEAILVSPHFLFRVEGSGGPAGNGDGGSAGIGGGGRNAAAQPVGDFALASRLSYFLWSSMPDDELFELAARGELDDDEVLEQQVRRMLADPRSSAFVENFAGQWLQTRLLERAAPDPGAFPEFDDELRRDMERETLAFFEAVLREDRSVLDFLDGDFTFVNERLARHYGIDGITGDELRRVSLADSPRGGILTQASILTLTSNPTRTSPVKRGKWILEQIMGTPPPPPPPNVKQLDEKPEAILSGSLRQRMERHRKDPNCAQCHERMDPIGFAFENFDAIGRWRDFDGMFVIDPSGRLPDGTTFSGPEELRKILRSRKELFCRNLAEKILTYALGRGLEYYDACAVDEILAALERDDYRITSMLVAAVKTRPFRMRRSTRGDEVER